MGKLHTKIGAVEAILPFIAAIQVLMLAGCGGGKGAFREDAQKNGDGKAPLSYYEATLRPSEFDEEPEIVQRAHAQTGTSANVDLRADSTVIEEVSGQGYRIQVFASSSIDEANGAKAIAIQRVQHDSVYVVYDPPVYKVRIGDYPTRLEANQQLARLVNIGYPDAWVVADRITQRKVVRIAR